MKSRLIYENFKKKINQNKKKKISGLLKKINKGTWPEFLKSFKRNYKYSYDPLYALRSKSRLI